MSKFREYLEQVNGNKETLESITKLINLELQHQSQDYRQQHKPIIYEIDRYGVTFEIPEGGHYDSLFGKLDIDNIKNALKSNIGKRIDFDIDFEEPIGDEGADDNYTITLSKDLLLKIVDFTKVKSFL